LYYVGRPCATWAEKYSWSSIPLHGIVMNLENVWKSICHKYAKGLENVKELNTYVSIRQISNIHRLPLELYINAYIRCKVYGNPKDYKRII
jgi:hypothetical protein